MSVTNIGRTVPCIDILAGATVLAGMGREAHAEVKRLRLTLICSPDDRVQALREGTIEVEGVDLNFIPLPVQEIFWRQLRLAT